MYKKKYRNILTNLLDVFTISFLAIFQHQIKNILFKLVYNLLFNYFFNNKIFFTLNFNYFLPFNIRIYFISAIKIDISIITKYEYTYL